MKQIILFIVFIFTIMMCSFAQEAPSSPIIKARDNKSTEFFKNKKLQSPISPMVLFSQKITGVVYTEGGKEVLIGASVIEVGSTNGTITDIDGEYSIGISKADKKILQASYLGYETKQERIGGRRVVNFTSLRQIKPHTITKLFIKQQYEKIYFYFFIVIHYFTDKCSR